MQAHYPAFLHKGGNQKYCEAGTRPDTHRTHNTVWPGFGRLEEGQDIRRDCGGPWHLVDGNHLGCGGEASRDAGENAEKKV